MNIRLILTLLIGVCFLSASSGCCAITDIGQGWTDIVTFHRDENLRVDIRTVDEEITERYYKNLHAIEASYAFGGERENEEPLTYSERKELAWDKTGVGFWGLIKQSCWVCPWTKRKMEKDCGGLGYWDGVGDIDIGAYSGSSSGSYYGQLNSNGVPKTVYVSPYTRRNGTAVKGHWRSAPGSNP